MEAVLFDMDGVLLDSEIPAFTMFQESLNSVGVEVDLEELLACIGKTSLEIAESFLKKNNSHLTVAEFMKIHRSRGSFYAVSDKVVPFEGEIEFIKMLQKRGIRMAVVSSTSTVSVITALNRMHLLQYFDAVVCSDMLGGKSKPAPDGYLKAAEFLGKSPEKCIVIEDSPTGIQAGKSAGMFVIGFKASECKQDTSKADIEVSDYQELMNDVNVNELFQI